MPFDYLGCDVRKPVFGVFDQGSNYGQRLARITGLDKHKFSA